jgi:fumarate reductase subunit D
MRISAVVIHQQIRQLFWYLLICFGLVVVLPLEEAVLNFRNGEGFFSDYAWRFSIAFSPLLMGLIGCTNVQADLNEKRYIFWRSKPASTKLFITVKYFVGLIAGLLITICPVVFAFISCRCNAQSYFSGSNNPEVLPFVLIGIMVYSLCFGSNVLIRRSARAWLIGMVVTCFVLVVPFMLPLGYKDFASDVMRSMSAFYISLIVIVSLVAFVFSLFAAEHDWHLKTNLKRLLWAGFGLVFAIMLFFSSQVANIRILQEKQIEYSWPQNFANIEGRILFPGRGYVDISKDNISLGKSFANPFRIIHGKRYDKKCRIWLYPSDYPGIYQIIGGDLYFFNLRAYGWSIDRKANYEKLYLRSFKLVDTQWEQASELEISDCLKGKGEGPVQSVHMAMQYIDNKIVAYINGSYAVIDVSEPLQLKLVNEKHGLFKWMRLSDDQKGFAISSIPVEGIGIKERIRLSIDLYYEIFGNHSDTFRSSIVDIDGDRISFFHFTDESIKRFDVTGWDDENIYCKLSVKRPFTILERIPSSWNNRAFVKNGKLYAYSNNKLMVFDIRSGERIRKLGHFVRIDFRIKDIAVLENGNILMCSHYYKLGVKYVAKHYLYLLKDPR